MSTPDPRNLTPCHSTWLKGEIKSSLLRWRHYLGLHRYDQGNLKGEAEVSPSERGDVRTGQKKTETEPAGDLVLAFETEEATNRRLSSFQKLEKAGKRFSSRASQEELIRN